MINLIKIKCCITEYKIGNIFMPLFCCDFWEKKVRLMLEDKLVLELELIWTLVREVLIL